MSETLIVTFTNGTPCVLKSDYDALLSAFNDRVRVIEMQLADKELLAAENANIKINCDYAWQNNRILEKARIEAIRRNILALDMLNLFRTRPLFSDTEDDRLVAERLISTITELEKPL